MRNWLYRHRIKLGLGVAFLIWYSFFCLPDKLFESNYSTVLESRDGRLMSAQVANDGQWRFPALDSVPHKYKTCLLQFEDAHFYEHIGFNPVSIAKAIAANVEAGEVVRGGSTLTQQVIRLSRKRNRSYWEKFIELIWATRLEFRHTKDEILSLYASHAPYGGNVVGLEMAAWRYYGKKPHQLSWSEAATLAVLPNAPGLIYPGKNQQALQKKRGFLLEKLAKEDILDTLELQLALAEPLPQRTYRLPHLADHLMHQSAGRSQSSKMVSTLDHDLQQSMSQMLARHHEKLEANGINNAAILVLHVPTNEVLTYIGNTQTTNQHQRDVDIIRSPRSTGSVLKPFLYATMLDRGELMPDQLVADIPTVIDGYVTKNYDDTYAGAVPASDALARSLNVPAVRMLREYGVERFYTLSRKLNLEHIDKGAGHYGLSLILGGAESSLWDITNAYAGMARTLMHYTTSSSEYTPRSWYQASSINTAHSDVHHTTSLHPEILGAGSIWLTFEAMKEVKRPEGEAIWNFYGMSSPVAWKTGTSFGNRDAWAIGVTPEYVVGVWTGNADGEGRSGMTGVRTAAPILFDAFRLLPATSWFETPFDDLMQAEVCTTSGFLANNSCPVKAVFVNLNAERTSPCPYHRSMTVEKSTGLLASLDCREINEVKQVSWFELPPGMAWYYKKQHPSYADLPGVAPGCEQKASSPMSFIGLEPGMVFTLPRNELGERGKISIKLAHQFPQQTVYWYLDEKFIGTTTEFHEISLQPKAGNYILRAVDETGMSITRKIEIARS